MKKLVSSVLSVALLISSLTIVSANPDEEILISPTDVVTGTLTKDNNTIDYYYFNTNYPDDEYPNFDFDLKVEGEGSCDVFVEFCNIYDHPLLPMAYYTKNGTLGEEALEINAQELYPDRYYISVVGSNFTDEVVPYTLTVTSTVSAPGIHENKSTPLQWNSAVYSHMPQTYWKFDLEDEYDVDLRFALPTPGRNTIILYNEDGIIDWKFASSGYTMSNTLSSGTYYLKIVSTTAVFSSPVGIWATKDYPYN